MSLFCPIIQLIQKARYRKRNKVCPEVVSQLETPLAEEMRTILSENIYFTDKGEGYTFINKLTSYPINPCIACESYMGGIFRLVSYEDLVKHTDWLKVNGQYLYPMLVWVMKNDKPVLVYLSLGKKKPLKILRHSSPDCLAYMICITKK